MKRAYHILLIALGCSIFAISTAQADDIYLGGGLALGTEADGTGSLGFGLDARGIFVINEQFRAAGNIHYFFAEDPITYWAIDANGHYVFVDEEVTIYGLAGLNYSTVDVNLEVDLGPFGGVQDLGGSSSEIGLNIGGGAMLPTDFGGLFGEIKYILSTFDQLVIVAGVAFGI